MEGWLRAPAPAHGEEDAIAWAVATLLEIGEAMIDGVPVPRFESIRRQIRSELKAAVGGSVRTAKIGTDSLWVWSGLVNDAKTPEFRGGLCAEGPSPAIISQSNQARRIDDQDANRRSGTSCDNRYAVVIH